MLPSWVAVVAVVINLSGTVSYLVHTVQGRTRPNRVTWALWTLIPLVTLAAQVDKGVGMAALFTFSAILGPASIFAASFVNRNAEWNLTGFDLLCGGLSVVGVVVWALTREGDTAIALSIAADLLAAAPTLHKSFRHPETESAPVYATAAIASGLTLLVLDQWTFASAAFALYVGVLTLLITGFVVFQPGRAREEQLPTPAA